MKQNDEGYVRCSFHDCYKCCLETQMLLIEKDLQRIENNGYSRKNFCLEPTKSEGFWQLKNINGRCFFLSDEGKCSIYSIRPAGCRVYPLVFELSEEDIIIDEDCREVTWFANQKYTENQIQSVKKLANTLLNEQKLNSSIETK